MNGNPPVTPPPPMPPPPRRESTRGLGKGHSLVDSGNRLPLYCVAGFALPLNYFRHRRPDPGPYGGRRYSEGRVFSGWKNHGPGRLDHGPHRGHSEFDFLDLDPRLLGIQPERYPSTTSQKDLLKSHARHRRHRERTSFNGPQRGQSPPRGRQGEGGDLQHFRRSRWSSGTRPLRGKRLGGNRGPLPRRLGMHLCGIGPPYRLVYPKKSDHCGFDSIGQILLVEALPPIRLLSRKQGTSI